MLQDDSNGETTFEIIDKKAEDLSLTADKTESSSSMSSSISLLPSPGVSLSTFPTGNLLSNVPPPSALPSFIPTTTTAPISTTISMVTPLSPNIVPPQMQQHEPRTSAPHACFEQPILQPPVEPFYHPTQFSAAIPPSKGVKHGIAPQTATAPSSEDSGGLIGWMKGAVNGSILTKVAERARNSVDSMITTLDPQMREYIYSGGDMEVLVASGQEIKVSAVREAFQSVFGKATVSGIVVQASNIAAQPVGFAAGVKTAEERIQNVFKNQEVQPMPVVAVENFILEVGEDKWYDLGVLILNDPSRQIVLQTFTQMTPIPAAVVTLAQEDTPPDYPLKWSGLSVTIGSLMGRNLQVSHKEWHQAMTGVSRRDMILLAAKTLAGLYKNSISQIS